MNNGNRLQEGRDIARRRWRGAVLALRSIPTPQSRGGKFAVVMTAGI